jgi:thiamine biosynthesis lipoprotein
MIGRFERRAFRAMGTSCMAGVTVRPGQRLVARKALTAAEVEVAACEAALSRFDPRSDLSRLNAAAGRWIEVDERLVSAVRAALLAREDTGGRFDPTILPALVAAGYDRTFDELPVRPAREVVGWRAGAELEADPDCGCVRLAGGAALDLGGIGKGFSAGRALDAMLRTAPELSGGLVDLGGDIAVRGLPPDGTLWRVGIADARRPGQTLGTIGISEGGVATSGRDRRRFGPDCSLHHLIDPTTGAPAESGPLAVTVVGPDPAQTEAHATALAISSLDEARDHLDAFSELSALYLPDADEPVALGGLALAQPTEPVAARL